MGASIEDVGSTGRGCQQKADTYEWGEGAKGKRGHVHIMISNESPCIFFKDSLIS